MLQICQEDARHTASVFLCLFFPLVRLSSHLTMSLHPSFAYVATPSSGWQIGVTVFESLDDAYLKICDHSHGNSGNLRKARRDHSGLRLLCKENSCPFEAYVTFTKRRQEYVLTRWNDQHSCLGVQAQQQGSAQNTTYIEAKVDHHRAVTIVYPADACRYEQA